MPTTSSIVPIRFSAALNSARRAIYRFAAMAYSDPKAETWPCLVDTNSQACLHAACELLRTEPAAVVSTLGLGESPLEQLDPAMVVARIPASAAELNHAYERTFGLLVTGACTPYETEYIDSKLSFQRAQQMADVGGFYHAFGVEPDAERPDHIALELEFMATLIDLESRAQTEDQLAVCRKAQADFVADHLAWWVPSFARLLGRENPDDFYASVGRLVCAFLPAERGLLGVAPHLLPTQPTTLERPEECEGCLLTL
jgi:TorA maturation chaperone TorD